MSKETDIAISVNVKDGPKMHPEKTKLPKDYCYINIKKAINEELELNSDKCKDYIPVMQQPKGADECSEKNNAKCKGKDELAFVAIHADRYKYKDSCGKEVPGICYWKKGQPKNIEFLDGPHVYVSRCLHPLSMEELHFQVCDEMLRCITEPEKKKVIINVTYGVGAKNEKKYLPCTECDSAAVAAAPPQEGYVHN